LGEAPVSFADHYGFRAQLVEALATDLIGPSAEDEIISDPPITRYIAGVLYPQSRTPVDPSQDTDLSDDNDDTGVPDPPVALANVRYPSSMGMTFAVDLHAAAALAVTVETARYRLITSGGAVPGDRHFGRRGAPGPSEEWQREPIRPEPVSIDVSLPTNKRREQVADGLELFWRVRSPDANSVVAVTLVLLNARTSSAAELRDADAFFQARMSVTAVGSDRAFVDRPITASLGTDEDLQTYRLLYRHARSFAVGHGCSVEWDVNTADPHRVSAIRTTFAPRYELRLSDSNPLIRPQCLEMRYLAGAPQAEVIADIDRFCAGYHGWIAGLATEAAGLPTDLANAATMQQRWCEEALARMRSGVHLLRDDPSAWEAFRLMNRAMLSQRARTDWLRHGRPPAGPVEDSEHRWRPFQLAFILLCLDGISRRESQDRRKVDLLWFPTAGGKTEAYLGLIAFTTFLRRLRFGASGGGVTGLMRYTLRLLTIQQFQRAALLICCCEEIRRNAPQRLGSEPMAVGLWIGQDGTPNTRREARVSLDKIRGGAALEKRNPMQLQSCPWCGAPLDHANYFIADSRLVIACRQHATCAFADGLPVYVVDEDIYDYRPTLLIATVDKFAGLPWREETATLFNRADPYAQPPELIIQDELHLISGPLGTLTGLYETAVDVLCSRDGVGPKVIASTATIRRAGRQTLGLFDREVHQFPPAGIDARESYFAAEAGRDVRGTRLYVGLMAPGISQTTLLVRAYAKLLQKVFELPASDEVKDAYWTLVGYFNSLRVLGGARMAVQDDVNDRIALLAREASVPQRIIENRIELTSREPSADIPRHLRRMSQDKYPNPDALDVILATNMISVGVDIDRLGLMVVMGQPPSTSEYIQATSRVGRQYPGLIVVLFNAAKSRDRSHYESFVAYHSALYRQVESTSVTPFSSRARDRGLHAVFVALARHLLEPLRPNAAAAEVEGLRDELGRIRELILERVRRVAPDEHAATAVELNEIVARWEQATRDRPHLVFRNDSHPENALLVDASRDDLDTEAAFPTLWSLRDVDRASGLYLVRRGDARAPEG